MKKSGIVLALVCLLLCLCGCGAKSRAYKQAQTLMDAALEAGAVDFITEDENVFDIRTEPNDLGAVRDALEAQGYKYVVAEVQYIPTTYTTLTDEDAIKNMNKMLEMFEDNDDVQEVWHNWENPDDE